MAVSLELPPEIATEMARRCEACGVRPDDLVAALLLQQWNASTIEDPGWKALDRLEVWKDGERFIPRWEDVALANSVTPFEIEGDDIDCDDAEGNEDVR